MRQPGDRPKGIQQNRILLVMMIMVLLIMMMVMMTMTLLPGTVPEG